uniref:Melatonin receptor 1Bb n=1 Tax=Gasterosteus aculeatus aculeatus TaxID=481459 RepID=A0AAQ4NY40_GASAC
MPDAFALIKNRTEPQLGQLERTLASDGSARPAWVIALLASVLIFTTVVDVLGNLLVIISVFRNRKLRNSGNVFVVSLAFADLVVAFYPYPLVLYALFHDGWALGNTQCTVSGFLMGLSVIGSIFNITGIAVNRYCYICHSFSYSRLYSFRNTLMFVALIWLLTVVAIIPNFFVGSLRYDPRVYSCTFAQNVSSSYTVTVVVVHFLVPIAVVTFCYLRIWVLVIKVRRKVKMDESPRLRPSDMRNFITMFVVFVLFAICWAPLNLIGLAVAIDPSRVAPRIPEWLFVLSFQHAPKVTRHNPGHLQSTAETGISGELCNLGSTTTTSVWTPEGGRYASSRLEIPAPGLSCGRMESKPQTTCNIILCLLE